MTDEPNEQPAQHEPAPDDFARQAEEAPEGLLREFLYFLLHNKKWWLTPIIVVLLIVGLLTVVGGGIAPLLYPLF